MSFSLRTFLFNICWGSLLAALTACGSPHHDSPSKNEDGGLGRPVEKKLTELLAQPELIVFEDVKKFVLAPSCVECHNSTGTKNAGVDLSSYEAIFGQDSKRSVVPFDPQASLIYETLIVPSGSRRMPPRTKTQLSEEQKNLVFQWVKNGAKLEASGEPVERPKSLSEELQPFFDDPKTIDYAVIKKHVFDNSCTKCHSSNGSKPDEEAILYGQDMTHYKDLFFNSGIVKNELVDSIKSDGEGGQKKLRGSRIYKSIAVEQSMPPASSGYKPMDSLRIKLLRMWILNCAIEDYSSIQKDTLLPSVKSSGKARKCVEPEESQ